MTTTDIIALLDAEISQLRQARALLTGTLAKKRPGRPKSTADAAPAVAKPKKKKRNLTPEGRARIAAAVKARWARAKKAAAK